jgi:molybdopterin-guanine dinucleotide biosynthesis protein A
MGRRMGRDVARVSAFIMAGGKSTRMGADKAFVTFEGRTLLARALELARSVTPEVCIVGDASKFAAYGDVVEDVFRECGPLGGIHAALSSSRTDVNLILAVDVPFVTRELALYLIAQARSSSATAIVPHVGGRWQPLCSVYRRGFADAAESALRAGRYKIDKLFDVVPTLRVEEEELVKAGFAPEMFRNLNTPEELEAIRNQ